jgi:hypothetical protein
MFLGINVPWVNCRRQGSGPTFSGVVEEKNCRRQEYRSDSIGNHVLPQAVTTTHDTHTYSKQRFEFSQKEVYRGKQLRTHRGGRDVFHVEETIYRRHE